MITDRVMQAYYKRRAWQEIEEAEEAVKGAANTHDLSKAALIKAYRRRKEAWKTHGKLPSMIKPKSPEPK